MHHDSPLRATSPLLVMAAALVTAHGALAQSAGSPEPAAAPATGSSPLTANIGLVSLYKYRGQDQYAAPTERYARPALQGGLDYAFANGLYLGNWNSTVRLYDPVGNKGNVEMDFYGGYKFNAGPLAWDVGALRYQYPGAAGLNTTELYGAATWKELTLKYSHTVSKKYFGLQDGSGTGYLNLAWAHPLREGLTLNAAVGHTFLTHEIRSAGLRDYTDYSVGVAWDVLPGTTLAATYAGADRAGTYGYINKGKAIVSLKYTY